MLSRSRCSTASWGVLASLAVLSACGGERKPRPGADGAVPVSTPVSRPRAAASAHETDNSMPLKLEGIGSKQELDRALAALDDEMVKTQFEMGFRNCFVMDRSLRNYASAVPAMEGVLERVPNFAPAFRVLAYAHFNLNFDMVKGKDFYEKAVEADPEYGEAHYALSFMLTQFDMERGRKHFERAMELGVPDERDLRGQFYP